MNTLCLASDLLPVIFLCTTNQFYTTIKELSRADFKDDGDVERYLELLSQVEEAGMAAEKAVTHLAESIKTINTVSQSTLRCQRARIYSALQRMAT